MNVHSIPHRATFRPFCQTTIPGQCARIGGAARETLALEDSDLDLCHVQPTGVSGSVVKLDATQDARRHLGPEHLLEAAGQMGVEVVRDQVNLAHTPLAAAQDAANKADNVGLGAPFGQLRMAPLGPRLDGDKDVASPGALVLVVQAVGLEHRIRTTAACQQTLHSWSP